MSLKKDFVEGIKYFKYTWISIGIGVILLIISLFTPINSIIVLIISTIIIFFSSQIELSIRKGKK